MTEENRQIRLKKLADERCGFHVEFEQIFQEKR